MTPPTETRKGIVAKPTIRKFKTVVTTKQFDDGSVLIQINGHNIASVDAFYLPDLGLDATAESSSSSQDSLRAAIEALQPSDDLFDPDFLGDERGATVVNAAYQRAIADVLKIIASKSEAGVKEGEK